MLKKMHDELVDFLISLDEDSLNIDYININGVSSEEMLLVINDIKKIIGEKENDCAN